MSKVQRIDVALATELLNIQKTFYEANCSMVLSNLSPEIENFLDEKKLLELMNTTPTETEAWDIVQMEEIERELF
jgi:anti-anti-sigma regulatory factor